MYGKIIITGKLVCKTGLHIGAQQATLEIGGLDMPIVRHPTNKIPYIPGSSFKGKLRSLLEKDLLWDYYKRIDKEYQEKKAQLEKNLTDKEKFEKELEKLKDNYSKIKENVFTKITGEAGIHTCAEPKCPISRLFGATPHKKEVKCPLIECKKCEKINECQKNKESKLPEDCLLREEKKADEGTNIPSRLIVRDLDFCNYKEFEDTQPLKYAEWKSENVIDRVTAAATPRNIERVPAGAEFNMEIVYNIEDFEDMQEDLGNIFCALRWLREDYLGGSGSRGYGKIEIKELKITTFKKNYFLTSNKGYISEWPDISLDEIDEKLKSIKEYFETVGRLGYLKKKEENGSKGKT